MGDITRNFSRYEFSCNCGCGFDEIQHDVVYALQLIRTAFNRKVIVTSGCRCRYHNASVGGNLNSKHLEGKAADFQVEGVSVDEVAEYIKEVFTGNCGIGTYSNFIHFDTREYTRSIWGV